MLTYTLKKTPGHPLYEQLYQSIRDDIAAGRLPAGSRLPSKRVLAAHLGVSVVTVESAYAQLVAELVLSIASVIMLARIFRRMQREDGASS